MVPLGDLWPGLWTGTPLSTVEYPGWLVLPTGSEKDGCGLLAAYGDCGAEETVGEKGDWVCGNGDCWLFMGLKGDWTLGVLGDGMLLLGEGMILGDGKPGVGGPCPGGYVEPGEGWVGILCIWWRGECIPAEYGPLDPIPGNPWSTPGCFPDGVKGPEPGVLGSCSFPGRELSDLTESLLSRVGGMCSELCCCSSAAIWLMLCWSFLSISLIWPLPSAPIFLSSFFFWLNSKNLDWKSGIPPPDLDESRSESIFSFVIFMSSLESPLSIEPLSTSSRSSNILLFSSRFSSVSVSTNLMMSNVPSEPMGKENENLENT